MIPPTPQQARVLHAIRKLTVDGVSPSYRELAVELKLGLGNVHQLVARLKDKGLVSHEPDRRRTIQIIEPVERIDLEGMTGKQLVCLRDRIDAVMAGRWNP